MGLVFRKTRKIRKSRKSWKSRKQSQRMHQIQSNHRKSQIGGVARMIIKYISKRGNTSENIQLISGQMNINMDMTKKYNLGQLNKEPRVELQGLGPGKQYLLTMTDPNALGKTWSHWVAEINSAGQVSKPAIVEYAPPNPPKGSGVHHYIFRLYDTNTLTGIPSPLNNMSRGDYFANILKPLIEGKLVLAEVIYTIDSSKIKNKKGMLNVLGKGIGLGMQIGLDVLKAFAR